MQRCSFCDFENEDGAMFCEQCKQDLTAGSGPDLEMIPDAGEEPEPVEFPPDMEDSTPDISSLTKPESPDEAAASAPFEPIAPETEPNVPFEPAEEPAEEEPVPAETDHLGPTPATTQPAPLFDQDVPEADSQTRPKLRVLRGERIDAEYVIYDGANYIGRTDEKPVDIDLEDQEPDDQIWTSRQHAVVYLEDGQLSIEDLNSLNGTFVNRTRIYAGQRQNLNRDDIVQIGKVQLRVLFG